MSSKEFNHQLLTYQNPLTAFAISLTKDYEDANDLVQETITKALVYRKKYSEEFNFKAWIFTIMRNTFFNSYKRNQKTNDIFAPVDPQELGVSDRYNTPEAEYNYKEMLAVVAQLDDIYRIPFERYNEGYKYQEIADEMDLAIGTVKSRIFLARKN